MSRSASRNGSLVFTATGPQPCTHAPSVNSARSRGNLAYPQPLVRNLRAVAEVQEGERLEPSSQCPQPLACHQVGASEFWSLVWWVWAVA
jgi:hypothetical protein